jgi:DNA polymerase-3 subunit gamma/tau
LSLALARKYRPTSFDDLVGQDTVSQTLTQALDSNRLSHAYLFSGLRGSGKTSTARIFAKALLCEMGESSHPCNSCSHCIMSNENRHLDIIEMDAASNRGIDDIKELIEHTKYKPSSARYKIFIIDEVHMLTPQAFNALLKTLEEPPSFVKFILATTDPLKLPATILSRTQHFRFKKIAQKLILQHLEHILNKEGVGYERDALDIIARSGAGSLRDALTLLDQAIVYSKNFVDVITITGMLGIIEPTLLDNLISNIINKEQREVLNFVKMSREYEAEMVIDELTLFLKDILLSSNPKLEPMVIDRFFRILAEAKSLLSLGGDGEFILTLTLFKMMEAMKIQDIDEMIQALEGELQGVTITTKPVTSSQKPVTQEPIIQKPEPEPKIYTKPKEIEKIDYNILFKKLQTNLYDRDYSLGECFQKNISFNNYKDNTLSWNSMAEGKDREQLIKYWSLINKFVKSIFGENTKIVNIPIIKRAETIKQNISIDDIQEQFNSVITDEEYIPINDFEMKSSCIAPPSGGVEAAKEKEPNNILDEPMIKEAIELFNPKKVRIIKK